MLTDAPTNENFAIMQVLLRGGEYYVKMEPDLETNKKIQEEFDKRPGGQSNRISGLVGGKQWVGSPPRLDGLISLYY